MLILWPLLAILLNFLVGSSPDEHSVLIVFATAFALLVPKGTKMMRRAMIVGMAVRVYYICEKLGVVFIHNAELFVLKFDIM